MLSRRIPYTSQPPWGTQPDWTHPYLKGALVVATPWSKFLTPPALLTGGMGVGARGGVLSQVFVNAGVANSAIVCAVQCSGPDTGGLWWQSDSVMYRDTSTEWPNDLGIFLRTPNSYGYLGIGARDSSGTARWTQVDVVPVALAPLSNQAFVIGATIDSLLLVTAYGNGQNYGTSVALQGVSYNPPTSGNALFGTQGGTNLDSVTSNGVCIRYGMTPCDAVMKAMTTNPWQVFL